MVTSLHSTKGPRGPNLRGPHPHGPRGAGPRGPHPPQHAVAPYYYWAPQHAPSPYHHPHLAHQQYAPINPYAPPNPFMAAHSGQVHKGHSNRFKRRNSRNSRKSRRNRKGPQRSDISNAEPSDDDVNTRHKLFSDHNGYDRDSNEEDEEQPITMSNNGANIGSNIHHQPVC